jgi:hypothetical protein
VAAVSTDAAARKRNHSSGQGCSNNRINGVPAGIQNFHARFVRMRIADDDPASVLKWWCTKGPCRGEPSDCAAGNGEK